MNKKSRLMMLKKAMMVVKVQQKMNKENQVFFNLIREIKTLIRKTQSEMETMKVGTLDDAINLVYKKVFSGPQQSNDQNDQDQEQISEQQAEE